LTAEVSGNMKSKTATKTALTACLFAVCLFHSALAGAEVPLRVDRRKPLPVGVVGKHYAAMVPIFGGIPPYSCAVSSGQLPPGLTVIARNRQPQSYCLIHGTPTVPGNWVGITILKKKIEPQ
jgi:hypothetical protein